MKNKVLTTRILVVLLALTCTACVGTKVRNTAGYPVAAQAWKGISGDIEIGITTALKAIPPTMNEAQAAIYRERVKDIAAALKSKDELSLIPAIAHWTGLRKIAQDGITQQVKTGLLSAQSSQSLLKRLEVFDELLGKLRRRL